MALPPHKLDDVFETIDNAETAFLADSHVKAAFAAAKAAYRTTENDIKDNPGLMGPGPNQAARVAFLDYLNE